MTSTVHFLSIYDITTNSQPVVLFSLSFLLAIQETMTFLTVKPLKSLSILSVLQLVAISLLIPLIEAVDRVAIPDNETVPAVIVFGDSIVDPGNNNNLVTLAKCNFPPYGRDFKGGKPTGRFSNGKVPGDFIAEIIGVKELVPAYLDPSLQLQDLLTGVSFASGAAGYDPLSAQSAAVYTLSDQLNMYKQYLAKIKSAVGEERTATMLSKSVHIVCLGSNDITNTYPLRSSVYDINSYTDFLVNSAISFYQEIYRLGARKIGVLSAPPTGCVPAQRTLSGGVQRECSKTVNDEIILFNSKLFLAIDSLDKQLPDAKLVYLDIYYPLLSVIQNNAQYGFEVTTRGCCGTGKIEVSILCNPVTAGGDKSCEDASKYIFWDSFHPTQRVYEILTTQVIKNNMNKFF